MFLTEDGGQLPEHVGEGDVFPYIHLACPNFWFYNNERIMFYRMYNIKIKLFIYIHIISDSCEVKTRVFKLPLWRNEIFALLGRYAALI